MIESTTCPICNKPGIPNFRKEVVVCPCCNSDLSIYRQIDELINIKEQDSHPRNNRKRFWGIVLACIIFICLGILIYLSSHKVGISSKAQVSSLNREITILGDSINTLQKEITHLKEEINSKGDSQDGPFGYFMYIVKPGDSFCKISRIFFGSEDKKTEISELNAWPEGKSLQPGDSLKIPVK